jgi:hypothetical protein
VRPPVPGPTDAAGLRKRLQAGRYIDAIPENIVRVEDNVPLINADSELDALALRHFGIALDHALLNLDGTAHRVYHAGKLNQHSVPGGLDDPAAVHGDLWVHELAPVGLEGGQGALLIGAHEPTVANNIGCKDRSQSSFYPRLGHHMRPDPASLRAKFMD